MISFWPSVWRDDSKMWKDVSRPKKDVRRCLIYWEDLVSWTGDVIECVYKGCGQLVGIRMFLLRSWIEKSLIYNGFKGGCPRDEVSVALVRMRSPVQIWLAAPKLLILTWIGSFSFASLFSQCWFCLCWTVGFHQETDRILTKLMDAVLEVASGKQVKAEEHGFREISIFKDGVTL